MKKKIFVTVGTTEFDELIETVLSPKILQALSSKGYTEMILQIGRSSLVPNCKLRNGFTNIEYFQLNPTISKYVKNADLVISHAGAGSILDALEARKDLIVVMNECLMHNHQSELAEQLHNEGHLYCCTCNNLLDVIETMDFTELKPFVNTKSRKIANFIDNIMGFSGFNVDEKGVNVIQ